MKNRLLILHGDDFGASTEVNAAIVRAFREGVLTSCSLMAGGSAFEDAVRLAHENPGLAVGIHVTCVAGRAVLPRREIPNLVDRSGRFLSDPARAGLKYFFIGEAARQLRHEFNAQFERFCSSGLHPSHIDGHCHMQVNPAVLRPLLEVGAEYGINKMRVPEDDFFAAAPFIGAKGARACYAVMFKLLCAGMKKKLNDHGFRYPARVYGNFATGAMSRQYVLYALGRLPAGVSEIYFHPAIPGGPLEKNAIQRQQFREFEILLDREVRANIRELGITPATYADLDNN